MWSNRYHLVSSQLEYNLNWAALCTLRVHYICIILLLKESLILSRILDKIQMAEIIVVYFFMVEPIPYIKKQEAKQTQI